MVNRNASCALINEVVETHRIDTSRIYVTGLSMVGYGSWGLAYTYPDLFAAAVPICGGGEPEKAPSMKEIPTWVFHGAKDEAVPLERSQEMSMRSRRTEATSASPCILKQDMSGHGKTRTATLNCGNGWQSSGGTEESHTLLRT